MGLPDFLIVGAMKAGTGSLWTYLCNHPDIHPATLRMEQNGKKGWLKETSYFGYNVHEFTEDDYRYLFKYKKKGQLTFEASTEYFTYPGTPERIFEANPRCKIIILARNPIDRAWSHYWHEVIYTKEEDLPFEQAIQRPLKTGFDHFHYNYLDTGYYIKHIERWAKLFPKKQVTIFDFHKFVERPEDIFRTILQWLGVKDGTIGEYKVINKGVYTEKMSDSTREVLIEHYRPYNKELYKLIGTGLGWA